jgi:hypothetical protein
MDRGPCGKSTNWRILIDWLLRSVAIHIHLASYNPAFLCYWSKLDEDQTFSTALDLQSPISNGEL